MPAETRTGGLEQGTPGPPTHDSGRVQIVPPAVGGAIRRHRAGRSPAGAQRRERQPSRDGERRRTTRRGARADLWSGRAAAQTAVEVAAPAVGGAPRRQTASVNAADADRRERKVATDGL